LRPSLSLPTGAAAGYENERAPQVLRSLPACG